MHASDEDWPKHVEPILLEPIDAENEWWQQWVEGCKPRELDWFERHALTGMVMLVAIVVGCAVMAVAMR